MMEAARTSETLVNFYQTTWRYNPEDSHLRSHRRENLKSYLENRALSVKDNNSQSSVPLFTDWTNQLQKFICVAGSLDCNECTCVILYRKSLSNVVAVLAEETKTSTCWANFASDFLGKRSNLAPISTSFFSSQYVVSFYYFIQFLTCTFEFINHNEW
jgi:hypothetical protein